MDDALIASLRRAAEANPEDTALRIHLAELLLAGESPGEAIQQCALVLSTDPGNAAALALLTRASTPSPEPQATVPPPVVPAEPAAPTQAFTPPSAEAPAPSTPAPSTPAPSTDAGQKGQPSGELDWERLEEEFDGPAMAYVEGNAPTPPEDVWELQTSSVRLADVGGMADVKQALDRQLLGPMRHPELTKAYGKTLRGGLLMYGPPGCGKTFIAKAIAGEMGANFISVSIADVLDIYTGASEQNMAGLFRTARQHTPAVLFFDELDTLGLRRSQLGHNPSLRGVVNQFLTELDGVSTSNEGVFVLGATNQPWDIDPALRRPGRFDRAVLVLPPDAPAREAIFAHHLRDRPVEGIDLRWLAQHSDTLTGADIARVCEAATEKALSESIASGQLRMLRMDDLAEGLRQTRPSADAWFASARNVVTYANTNGEYDELKRYMKQRKLL